MEHIANEDTINTPQDASRRAALKSVATLGMSLAVGLIWLCVGAQP